MGDAMKIGRRGFLKTLALAFVAGPGVLAQARPKRDLCVMTACDLRKALLDFGSVDRDQFLYDEPSVIMVPPSMRAYAEGIGVAAMRTIGWDAAGILDSDDVLVLE